MMRLMWKKSRKKEEKVLITFEEIQTIVAKVAYKNWKFCAGKTDGYIIIYLYSPVVDIIKGDSTEVSSVTYINISEIIDEKSIIDEIYKLIIDIENHETGEHFCVDGARPFDPHGNFGPAPYTGKGFRYPSGLPSGFNTNYFNNVTYS